MKVLDEKLLKSNIEKRAKEDIEKQNISGAAVAVMQAGKTLYKGCFGAVKENTLFVCRYFLKSSLAFCAASISTKRQQPGKRHGKRSLLSFDQEEEGRRGGIDDLEFAGAELLAVQERKLFFDQLALDRAFLVTGINGDEERAVRIQKIDRRADGDHGRISFGGDGFITAGQKSEIEHTDADLFVYVIQNVGVGIKNERVIRRSTAFGQEALRAFKRLGLNFEGVDLAVFTDGVGEPKRIVSVSHREVDGNAALFYVRDKKIFFNFQKIDHIFYFLSFL